MYSFLDRPSIRLPWFALPHHLTPDQSEKFCLNTVRDLFERAGPSKSFIISELIELAKWPDGSNFDRHTVTRHVDILVAIGEVKRERDHNQIKFRKNGMVLKQDWVDENSPSTIRITLNELDGGKFVMMDTYMGIKER